MSAERIETERERRREYKEYRTLGDRLLMGAATEEEKERMMALLRRLNAYHNDVVVRGT